MNDKKICFISSVNNEKEYEENLLYIKNLNIPEGYQIETIGIKDTKSVTSAYNTAMEMSDAKYKVYTQDNVLIINKDFIRDMLGIFEGNCNIGLMGVVGAYKFPINGTWNKTNLTTGKLYSKYTGKLEILRLSEINEKYNSVEIVDKVILITQYDIQWREDLFNESYLYDSSQSMEFKKKGYEVVVPKQVEPWIIEDCNLDLPNDDFIKYEKYREVFIKEYIDNNYINDDLYYFNKQEAFQCLLDNRKRLERYLVNMNEFLKINDYENASRAAYYYGCEATTYHPGFYASKEIEDNLLICAQNLPKINIVKDMFKPSEKRKVLHVLSEGLETGGHTRLAKNWMICDKNSVHSIVTTWNHEHPLPEWIINVARESGGDYYSLGDKSHLVTVKAAMLREIARAWADVVILHVHMMDVVHSLAFGVDGGPPIMFVNHADHRFWIGTAVVDMVIDGRKAGQSVTWSKRGIKNSQLILMPLDRDVKKNRKYFREKLGIRDESTVIITIADGYKFKSLNNNSYDKIAKKIVERVESVIIYVIGMQKQGKWEQLEQETNGRVRIMGKQTNIEQYYSIADIYLDCYMIGGPTATVEAGLYGIPIIKFYCSCSKLISDYGEMLEDYEYKSIEDIINEIYIISCNKLYGVNKGEIIKEKIECSNIINKDGEINKVYEGITNHKVNKNVVLKNRIDDEDLFWVRILKD